MGAVWKGFEMRHQYFLEILSPAFVIICYLFVADEGVGLPPFRADLVLRSNLLGGSLFIYCLFSPQ